MSVLSPSYLCTRDWSRCGRGRTRSPATTSPSPPPRRKRAGNSSVASSWPQLKPKPPSPPPKRGSFVEELTGRDEFLSDKAAYAVREDPGAGETGATWWRWEYQSMLERRYCGDRPWQHTHATLANANLERAGAGQSLAERT
eukprot:232992-Prorocentrum_minimum.AAC.2